MATILRPNEFSCSEFRITRFQLMARSCRLFQICDEIVMSPVLRHDRASRAAALRDVDSVRRGFQDWFIRWHDILNTPLEKQDFTELGKGDSRLERDNSAVAAQIQSVLCNRLHIALGGDNAFEIEMASRELVANFSPVSYPRSHGNALFNNLLSQAISRSFWATTQDWQAYAGRNSQGPIEPHLWRQWLSSWGVFPDNFK